MPTTLERARLRADLDADDAALTDAEIDDALTRAAEYYGDNAPAVSAAARVIAIQQLLAGAAKRADVTQNQSGERLSQIFDHLLRLRAIYERDLRAALDSETQPAVDWGGLRRRSARIEEYPDA